MPAVEDFQFMSPTNLVLKVGAEAEAGRMIRPYADRALIVLGGDFIKDSEWYPGVIASLTAAGVGYEELSGIQPNPTLEAVNAGIELVRTKGIGFILSIGGGSAIDTAKAIGLGAANDVKIWDVYTKAVEVDRSLPVGCIMTIPSSGSEASNGSVITNAETGEKFDVMGDFIRPVFALMNPEITYSAPRRQIFSGIVDMFSHSAERYYSQSTGVELTDRLCEAVMSAIITCADQLLEDFTNYDARANLMLASVLSHNGLTGIGRQQDWASHTVAAPLSGEYHCVHGETISVIMPNWAQYVSAEAPARLAQLGVRVFGAAPELPEARQAEAAIGGMRAFFDRIGMPATLRDLGIDTDEKFESMAEQATRFWLPGNLKQLNRDDVVAIYQLAK